MSLTRADDERLLQMLHLREVERVPLRAIAERYGMRYTAAKQILSRTLRAVDREIGPALDGSERPLWWRSAGSRRRRAAIAGRS